MGTLSSVSAFNQERAPMSCLLRLNALEAQIFGLTITYNGATRESNFNIVCSKTEKLLGSLQTEREVGFKMEEKVGCSN